MLNIAWAMYTLSEDIADLLCVGNGGWKEVVCDFVSLALYLIYEAVQKLDVIMFSRSAMT